MKNYRLHLFILFFVAYLNCYSRQNPTDTTKDKSEKFNFSFDFGTQYHSLLRNHYFPLDTFSMDREISLNDWPGRVGRTYQPSFGFHTGLLCNYTFKRIYTIESGLQLYFRQAEYIEDLDTTDRNIVNNYNVQHSYSLDTFKTILNSSLNIEVPVYIGYSLKRFNFSVGAHITTLTFVRVRTTSLNNYETTDNNSHDILNLNFSPSIKIKYLLPFDKVNISSYFAINKRYWKFYDFQIGFEVKFYSLK